MVLPEILLAQNVGMKYPRVFFDEFNLSFV